MNPRQIAAQRVRDQMRNLNEAIAAARGDFALHLHAPVIFVVMHEITHTIPLWFDRQNGDHFLRVEVYPFGEGMTYYRSNPSPTVEQKKCRIRVLLGGQIGEEYFFGRVYPDGGSEEDNDRAMALCKEVITSVREDIDDVNERDRMAVELRHEMYSQMYKFVKHWKRQIKTLARKLFASPLKRLTREDYNRTFRHWEVSPAYWYFEQQLNAAGARRDAAMRAEIEIRRALAGGRRAAERRIAHWPEVHTHRSIAQNTGVAFSTTSEREIIEAITQNRGLTKVSINLRLPEGRFKIEKATIRNQEIRRILRRQEAAAQAVAAEKAKGPLTTRPPKETETKKKGGTAAAERKISGAQELARKTNTPKLAVAGATEQPKAGSSSASAADKSLLREKARDMEREAMKPKESKTAERVLLSERLRETGVESGVAARRAKFGEKASKDKSGEKATKTAQEKEEKKTTERADGTVDKQKSVANWREKLAERDAKAKELVEKEKSGRTAKADEIPSQNEQQKSGSKEITAKKVPKKAKPKEEGGTTDEKGTPTKAGEKKKPETAPKKVPSVEKTKVETAPKTAELAKTTPTERSITSWRDRMNVQK